MKTYTINEKTILWLCRNDCGRSSLTLLACYYDMPPFERWHTYPRDPDDFGRCKRFLGTITTDDKKSTLERAAKLSSEWKALIKEWDYLENLYDDDPALLFEVMQKIIKEVTDGIQD